MKPAELKRDFITLRAEGKSHSQIADQLHISKTTCTKWEKELAGQIDELKRKELEELCESYGMAKKTRIQRLGNTLDKINTALDNADFSAVDPAKLLDFKLKYTEALKVEYAGLNPAIRLDGISATDILKATGDLLNRVHSGEIPADSAQKESQILTQLLKAYDTVEVRAKLDELEAIIGGRQ